MPFQLTNDKLQSIAVNCVTQFLNKEASLSQAVSKQAQALELNPEQTKRVIEASNTIAHLRQLEKAADRTFEFKVADYNEVMADMCVPPAVEKTAAAKEPEVKEAVAAVVQMDSISPVSLLSSEYFQKSAERTTQEQNFLIEKEMYRVKSQLEKMATDKVELQLSLASATDKVHKDPRALEKIACVISDEPTQNKMLKLCGIEKRAAENLVFTNKDLAGVNKVYDLYKQAVAMLDEEAKMKYFADRAYKHLYEKKAGIIGDALGSVAGGITGAIGWMGKKVLGGGLSAAKSVGNAIIHNPGRTAGIATTVLEGQSYNHANNVNDLNSTPS